MLGFNAVSHYPIGKRRTYKELDTSVMKSNSSVNLFKISVNKQSGFTVFCTVFSRQDACLASSKQCMHPHIYADCKAIRVKWGHPYPPCRVCQCIFRFINRKMAQINPNFL